MEEFGAADRHEGAAMTGLAEEQIAELIAHLPPAPAPWVQAAVELPEARAAIDELVTHAITDRDRREAILADLEAALREAGVEPQRHLVAALRARLGAPSR
jgi:hypothetical protein